jgi:lipoprotein
MVFKKILFQIMAILTPTLLFLSCGGGSSTDIPDEPVETGVHRIEVAVEGDLGKFSPHVLFEGATIKGMPVTLFDEKGEEQGILFTKNYDDKPFSEVTAYTASNAISFQSVLTMHNRDMNEGVITVKFKGFVDGKLKGVAERKISFAKTDILVQVAFDSIHGVVIEPRKS